MSIGGITDRLVTLSRTMVGHWPGSRADQRSTFGVLCRHLGVLERRGGSSKIFIEAQTKEGYDLPFDRHYGGIRCAGGNHSAVDPDDRLGCLIPRIGALYLAGILPACSLLAPRWPVHVYAKLRHYPAYPRATWRGRCRRRDPFRQ
jgi:TRAP-type C4-dicarboxylate transport system permease large subunit